GNNMKTMKVLIYMFFAFIQFSGFSQNLEEREKITAEFEKRTDTQIELFNINSSSKLLDSIQLKSEFLKKKNIDYKILGFRISVIDKNGEKLFSFKSSKNNLISTEFSEKIANCEECKNVKVDLITINWFTGTYTLKNSKMWNIK
ncbi:hypothetical protein, partial [Thalassobellus citreus]|uniref:hypothetical protein n=1 Tax=Thalassobellus citreus TaxID=3367752 RepID=UPI00378C920B